MRRYILSPEAEQDLDDIKSHLTGKAGLQVTRYVLGELRPAMRFLAKIPGAGHRREDLTEDTVSFWPVFSYLIVYNPEPRPIEIVRVLHGNRDVKALLESDEERPLSRGLESHPRGTKEVEPRIARISRTLDGA